MLVLQMLFKIQKPYKGTAKAIYHPKIFSVTLKQTTQKLRTEVQRPTNPIYGHCL